ncbi:mannitol dehydrogenase [Halomonas sp. SL1]|uniref:mannitol dehydrogenase family protein n=1 Tax=Halomonas sp. SL1 TaxID=2137478 RepID=UPI000D179E73|nr:mannitol dehydrogenase [Halomonas sp. SL1]RAH38401.1 mannitol dehydrogenase [Halomonas sp. SL1]
MTIPRPEILQFGIGRFLLAHVDHFVSQSLETSGGGKRIVAVQSSSRPEGRGKALHLAECPRYPLWVRGRRDGKLHDREEIVDSLATCLIASKHWAELEQRFCEEITHVVSNTGDTGYYVAPGDSPLQSIPDSFPAKLVKLLHARFSADRSGVILMPCELIQGNGQRLKAIVTDIAWQSYDNAYFNDWLATECLWVDTLVDRIVSAALDPIGAIAEPYGLWAIQDTPGLHLPCRHPDVQRVDDLAPYEQRKLHMLNLSHTWLVHRWRELGLEDHIRFVREAMEETRLRKELESLLDEEVVPVLDQHLPGMGLEQYKATVLERFTNPFLDHALADIAQNHEEKLNRRLRPISQMAISQGRATPRLTNALKRHGLV